MAMFGLFGKKKEKPESPKNDELRAFAAQFDSDEVEVLVLTGAGAFAAARMGEETLLTGVTELTAWMEKDGEEIHQGQFRLVSKGDETLMGYLRQRIPRDFILKCTVRLSQDRQTLLLTNLPEPGFDPDLKALMDAQRSPVTTQVEGLGEFSLNRAAGVLQRELDWLGTPVQLCLDKDEDHALCAQAALTLLNDLERWDAQARQLAAERLLDTANEWLADADEDEEELTASDFMARLEPETVDVSADGSFHLYFNDGGIFFGHFIHVSGTVSEGVTDAAMEG